MSINTIKFEQTTTASPTHSPAQPGYSTLNLQTFYISYKREIKPVLADYVKCLIFCVN